MTHVFSLARAIRRQGHQVHVVNGRVRFRRQFTYTRTLAAGLPFSTSLSIGRLERLVRRWRFDVIHAHSKAKFFLAARLSRTTGVPLVITCHAATLVNGRYESAFRQARFIICPWPRLADLMGPRDGRTVMIPNGIELDRFAPGRRLQSGRGPLRLLYLGRIDAVRRPGVVALCKAVRGVRGVELSLATNRRIRCRPARFLGWLHRPALALARSNVVVGTGRAVLEGMASGCVALVLGEGWDGLVTPENVADLESVNFLGTFEGRRPAVVPIRRTLAQLAADPALRRDLSVWGRSYVAQHYDINCIAGRTLEIYKEALD